MGAGFSRLAQSSDIPRAEAIPPSRLRDVVVELIEPARREKDFGEAYGKNRTGEWEYVEYRADETYITPPQKSFACAECHVKAGREKDFVYKGWFPAAESKSK